MTHVEKLKQFIAAVDYPVNIQVIECFWYKDGDEIYWNTANSLEDLREGNGDTYSAGQKDCGIEFGGYYIINCDNGCGDTLTYLFDLDLEANFD